MTGVEPYRFVQVSLLGRRVNAHLVAVTLPLVPELPLGQGLARDKQLGIDRVQVPLKRLTPGAIDVSVMT